MLQLETISHAYAFHSYETDRVRLIHPDDDVNTLSSTEELTEMTQTFLVHEKQIITDGLPVCFSDFKLEHVKMLSEIDADIFLIGTASQASFPEVELHKKIIEHKISMDFMDIGAACRTHNILVSEYRNLATLIFFNL